MGSCPSWYVDFKIADRLRIDVREVPKIPIALRNMALTALRVEAQSQQGFTKTVVSGDPKSHKDNWLTPKGLLK